jgi:hypothetical protein
MLIFARVRFKNTTLTGVPTASVGAANPTGLLNKYLLLHYQQNCIAYETPCKEELARLNFESLEFHISVPSHQYDNTAMLTFPPRASHKLQPSNHTAFRPYKRFHNYCLKGWMN